MDLQLALVKHQILCSNLVSHKEHWLDGRTLNWGWLRLPLSIFPQRENKIHPKHSVNIPKVWEDWQLIEPLLLSLPYTCLNAACAAPILPASSNDQLEKSPGIVTQYTSTARVMQWTLTVPHWSERHMQFGLVVELTESSKIPKVGIKYPAGFKTLSHASFISLLYCFVSFSSCL